MHVNIHSCPLRVGVAGVGEGFLARSLCLFYLIVTDVLYNSGYVRNKSYYRNIQYPTKGIVF